METISPARRVLRTLRWPLVTAIGPIAFGSTYFVTHHALPPDAPLWGSAIRALPAGLVLLLIARRLPRGAWWWRSLVLGTLNMGVFFCLVYVAAQLLPASVAASLMSLSPLVIAGAAWLMIGERPTIRIAFGAIVGAAGVLLIVGTASGALDGWGIAASIASMVLSSIGAVLTKRWRDETPVLTVTAWQLVVGGIELTAAAVLVEGAPPQLTAAEALAFAYVSLIATALGFVCWFAGFRHLRAGTVGVIGLLNPVTGVALGVAVGGETLTALQLLGVVLVLASIALVNTQPRARDGGAGYASGHDELSGDHREIMGRPRALPRPLVRRGDAPRVGARHGVHPARGAAARRRPRGDEDA
ncbi:DMT family transporter [Agromyces soli]